MQDIRVVLVRDLETELPGIVEERVGVVPRDLIRVVGVIDRPLGHAAGFLVLLDPLGCDLHLVFARPVCHRVFGHVADVRDVHHVLDAVTGRLQKPPNEIREQKRPEVADVGKVVDGRPARIDADDPVLNRNEWLDLTRECVEKANSHTACPVR